MRGDKTKKDMFDYSGPTKSERKNDKSKVKKLREELSEIKKMNDKQWQYFIDAVEALTNRINKLEEKK